MNVAAGVCGLRAIKRQRASDSWLPCGDGSPNTCSAASHLRAAGTRNGSQPNKERNQELLSRFFTFQ